MSLLADESNHEEVQEYGQDHSRIKSNFFIKLNSQKACVLMKHFHSLLDYPWRKSSPALSSNLIKWLYLPDYAMSPNATFILCD